MPRTCSRALTALAVLVASVTTLAALAGCGHRAGREVESWEHHNLVVDNDDAHHSVTVYIDRGDIGTIEAEGVGYFRVTPGLHSVHLRSGNDLNPLRFVRAEVFDDEHVVEVVNTG